jgi:hypothetical protein
MLDGIALFFIFFLIVCVAAAVVAIGSLPGKIARRRGHPHPDAVNAASWIGLATGVFWPVAFVWAFLPVPGPTGTAASATTPESTVDVAKLQARLASLEAEVEALRSHAKEATS